MTSLVAFLGLCLLITITPGLDTAVVVRSTLRGGTAAGLRTAAGCALGLFAHAIGVGLGLAGLLLRSATAFEILKLAGAVLLVLLGGRSLWSAWRAQAGNDGIELSGQRTDTRRWRTPFVQGLLTNLTNPKATLFFVATLPQFVPADRPAEALPAALGLAVIAVSFSVLGLSLVSLGVNRARQLLKSRRVRRVQEWLLGVALIGLGVRVATE